MNLTLTIDGISVQVLEGTTILDAAKAQNIEIPHLCFFPGLPPNTSCMLCLVQEVQSGRLIPSCSAPVAEGMVIETQNSTLAEARRAALELILREHVGDCEAPCQKVCPLHLFIPKMIRLIERGEIQEATNIVFRRLSLPGFLTELCPAPCLKGCRRSQHDTGVSIPHLVRYVVEQGLLPMKKTADCGAVFRVAVVGAGATGLSAAMEIVNQGHQCTLFDSKPEIGGMLLEQELSGASDLWQHQRRVLDAWGCEFKGNTPIQTRAHLDQLIQEWDAIILCTGSESAKLAEELGLPSTKSGFKVDRMGAAGRAKVFAAGEAIKPVRTLPKAIAAGQAAASTILRGLSGNAITETVDRFNSKMGRLQEGEREAFLQNANPDDAVIASRPENSATPNAQQAAQEASRCLHCDCRKPNSCKLRFYADQFGAKAQRFKMETRPTFTQENANGRVIFEPMKCIKCGICVQIMDQHKSEIGLTFINRGIDMRPAVPFDQNLDEALGNYADDCVRACPTAALSFAQTPPKCASHDPIASETHQKEAG